MTVKSVRKFTYLIAVSIVSDIGTSAVPPSIFVLGSPLRVEEWFHAMRIQAAALYQIDDSEAIGHPSLHIPDSEVKPLHVLPCIQVTAHAELIVIHTPE